MRNILKRCITVQNHWTQKQVKAEEFQIKMEVKFDEFPPMVEDTSRVFFCEFMQEIDLEETSTRPLILKIKKAYIDKKHDEEPICRIGKTYAKIGEALDVPEIPE